MRIAVNLVVDVDPEEWANTYGLTTRPGQSKQAAVREDVRSYLLNLAQCSAGVDESAATVALA